MAILSAEQRDLLITGYLRNTLQCIIPLDIINLCEMYYPNKIYWVISKKDVKNLQYDESTVINGPKFIVNNVEFQCIMHENDTYLQFGVVAFQNKKKFKLQIISLYVDYYCNETNTAFKKVIILHIIN